jgi:murein DD-endopeptidase MepM/ murein hydrolase activator NlpD
MSTVRAWKARLSTISRVLGVTLLLGVFWLARELGLLLNALFLFIMASAAIAIARRVIDVFRRRLSFGAYSQPRRHLPELGAALLRVVAWLCFAAAVDFALVAAQFSQREVTQIRVVSWLAAGLLALSALVPRRSRGVASDALFGALLGLVSIELWRGLSEPPAGEQVALESPFQEPVYVFQGGGGSLLNHHAALPQQAWALDLLPLTAGGAFFEGERAELGSHACFGAALAAPVSGRVVHVRGDLPDMPIGQTDRDNLLGNSVTIETEAGRYVLLAHLQANSIEVADGDRVIAGQRVARCGNSGNTSMPHLHLQVQNRPAFSGADPELRTFPIVFASGERLRAGARADAPFSVRRNDVVRPTPSRCQPHPLRDLPPERQCLNGLDALQVRDHVEVPVDGY